MEFKGTKGEWEKKFSKTDNATVIRTVGSKNFIARLPNGNGEEIEANAKLIASAPELLKALQTVVVAIESMDFQDGTLFKASHYKAINAINKALN